MSMKLVHQKIRALENAKAAATQAIMDKMEKVARRRNLDEFSILPYGNIFYRRGKEVKCPEIQRLDNIFLDNIHSGGFEALWDKEKGWW